MKTTWPVFVLALAVLSGVAGVAYAGPGYGRGGGWGCGTAYNRMFDPATVTSISGVVSKVEKIAPLKGMSYGIHIVLKTDAGDETVHLGPSWYMENQEEDINEGDSVAVTGSRVDMGGSKVIIASEVKKGDDVLVLRDKAGVPAWSGWRRR